MIRISSPKTEGILQVSKWIKVQVLLDAEEMADLLRTLEPVHFVAVSEPVLMEKAVISAQEFLEKYTAYVDALKKGSVLEFRRFFSSAMTRDLVPFYAIPAGPEKYLIKPTQPVVQLQAHSFFYSRLDGKFHPMVLSEDSISWGLQFSYPQYFQDPKTRQVVKTTEFSNTALFTQLMRWMRSHTQPTPFVVDGVRVNAPIRIGKKTLSWIKSHPQLKLLGIST